MKMINSIKRIALTCILGLLVQGCIVPDGMSKAEFDALPKDQRDALRTAQIQKNLARLEQRRAEEANQVQALAENPRFGDIVTVIFDEGRLTYKGRIIPFQPMQLDLVKGQRAMVTLRSADGVQARATFCALDANARSLRIDGYEMIENEGWRTGNPEWHSGRRYKLQSKPINDTGIADLQVYVVFKRIP